MNRIYVYVEKMVKQVKIADVCSMCDNYMADTMCEHMDSCTLVGVVKENARLQYENEQLRKKVSDYEWDRNPDRMGE